MASEERSRIRLRGGSQVVGCWRKFERPAAQRHWREVVGRAREGERLGGAAVGGGVDRTAGDRSNVGLRRQMAPANHLPDEPSNVGAGREGMCRRGGADDGGHRVASADKRAISSQRLKQKR